MLKILYEPCIKLYFKQILATLEQSDSFESYWQSDCYTIELRSFSGDTVLLLFRMNDTAFFKNSCASSRNLQYKNSVSF